MSADYPESWGEDESQLWEHIAGDFSDNYGRMAEDQHAVDLFNAGWLESGYSKEDREAIRNDFFDYAAEDYDFDADDFDWMAWREAMGY